MRPLATSVVVLVLAAACTQGDVTDSTTGSTAPIVSATSTTADVSEPSSTSSVPPTTTTTIPLEQITLQLTEIDDGFDFPVLVVAAPDGGPDLIVEQPGRIVRADGRDHAVVIDISEDVVFDGEQGLLGLAVHPDHDTNGLVYINYVTSPRATVVESVQMIDGTLDPATRTEIIRIPQPAENHNGGMMAFGPDGFLWIGMGDGGGADDVFGNGQDPTTRLGAMLRIAVGPEFDTYAVPDTNPFVGTTDGAPEVWSYGLRNPWRFTFDGDDVWIADVGQRDVEEVNVADAAQPGINYGWNIMEGSQCFQTAECDTDGLYLPITEYEQPRGCSITGGVVYRGDLIPSLRGHFLYADFCTGLFESVNRDGTVARWTEQVDVAGNITGFGTGSDGEAYVVTRQGGLFRVETDGS